MCCVHEMGRDRVRLERPLNLRNGPYSSTVQIEIKRNNGEGGASRSQNLHSFIS